MFAKLTSCLAVITVALLSCAFSQSTLSVPASAGQVCSGSNCPVSSGGLPTDRLKGQSQSLRPDVQQSSEHKTAPPTSDQVAHPFSAPEHNTTAPEQLSYDISPLAPETEFQTFVASSIGQSLPIYGQDLFTKVPSTFAPLEGSAASPEYIVGPGDELIVHGWGQIDLEARVVVDRAGEIYLPRVGTISVTGVQYRQLRDHLRSAIARVFKNFELSVTLGQMRSVQVFVVGQARRPGSYTVSSLSTLVNAIFACGGPSARGSMRRIQLKRSEKVISEFDLYDLLIRGDKSKDHSLLPGDVIYFPSVGPLVAMSGSVTAPAIYELKGDSTLAEQIELAGGLATTADGGKVVVERIDGRAVRKVEQFPLDDRGKALALKDGDVVKVLSISPRFENAVTLRGSVAEPGRYPWRQGMRISDLLPDWQALITRDYWKNQNNLVSTSRDEKKPQLSLGLISDVRNEIRRNAPEINWDYAVIQRLSHPQLSTTLIPFNLGKAIIDRDVASNLELEAGDIVTIFSQHDLAVSIARQSKLVRLEGEFASPGVYRVEPGETLRQLVARVGGLSQHAYLYGAEFSRDSVRQRQQNGIDQIVRTLELDIARSGAASAIDKDDAAAAREKLQRQEVLLSRLRGVKATGRMVLNLSPRDTDLISLPDIVLEDGDRFMVPYRPSTVEVLGAVYNKNSLIYSPGALLSDYLALSGGPTRDADRSRIFVIRADGTVLSKQSKRGILGDKFEAMKLNPGDAIVVPDRIHGPTLLKGIRDWSQVFSQFALGMAAVRVID